MTPTQFLTVAGPASLFLGILGFLEPGFSEDLWFDAAENIVHTGFGLLALFALSQSLRLQWHWVFWTSLFAGVIAIGGMLVVGEPAPNFVVTNLEHPMDNALHLTFLVAGLIACMPKGKLSVI